MKKYIFAGVVTLLLLSSCNNKSESKREGHSSEMEAHHEENHEAGKEHSDEIILPSAKAQAVGVQSMIIQPGLFNQIIKTSGQIEAAQGNEKTVVATVNGIVSFQKKVVQGISVGEGTGLMILSSNNLTNGDPVQRTRVTYETARKEYERMKALVTNKIVSEKEFAQAKQDYESARISYNAVIKNHSAKGQLITSPMNGYIKDLLVREGDYVEVGQPLVSITQNRKLFLRADVSERYYSSLRSIKSANFCTPYDNKVNALEKLNGKLLSYGKATGTDNSYYLPVIFEFDNKGDFIPGTFVEIYLLSTPMNNVISLPHSALTEEQGSIFVYLQVDEEGYKKQLVTVGADDGQRVQIISGIKAGDRVVTEGAYQVKLAGATNAIPPHSHEH
ncbi:MAG: efflux RND transporter periplasmic adaptor subunit [Bacteroides sp.]|jgi:RND family efflux transporter MFP subunit|nr:efflux RND transporter periplasmic adaptor subunit [Bacteroides sp.]MCI1681858.1 efflux RND transporter periplasmic adaptor subunit [Bacteroides sp.]